MRAEGGGPYQPHPGARRNRYRCSLPGLTGFTAGRREGTGTGHH
jgi:hypothetical protein